MLFRGSEKCLSLKSHSPPSLSSPPWALLESSNDFCCPVSFSLPLFSLWGCFLILVYISVLVPVLTSYPSWFSVRNLSQTWKCDKQLIRSLYITRGLKLALLISSGVLVGRYIYFDHIYFITGLQRHFCFLFDSGIFFLLGRVAKQRRYNELDFSLCI